jgi:CheY-like chemotaxis protein
MYNLGADASRPLNPPLGSSERSWIRCRSFPLEDHVGSRLDLRGVDVLVVEDHDDSRQAMCVMLGVFGASTRGVRNGEEALLAMAQRRPDLVLCDLIMPVLDGFALVTRIRADAELRGVRVVAMTGWMRDDEAAMRSADAGFDGHVVKPLDPETLARQLNLILKPSPDAPEKQ